MFCFPSSMSIRPLPALLSKIGAGLLLTLSPWPGVVPGLVSRVGPGVLTALLFVQPAGAQTMLPGCQLLNGTLQCVPGISADPQQQIVDLRQDISTDQGLENAVEQRIGALQQLVIQGQSAEGSLLQASLSADVLAGLPPNAFHWYRLAPASGRWVLIEAASGPSYLLGPNDVNGKVMLVVAVPTAGGGSLRQASGPVGPVQGR